MSLTLEDIIYSYKNLGYSWLITNYKDIEGSKIIVSYLHPWRFKMRQIFIKKYK